jgi:hypothetical protein
MSEAFTSFDLTGVSDAAAAATPTGFDWGSISVDPSLFPSFDPSTFQLPIQAPTSILPSGAGVLSDLGNLVHSATQPIIQYYTDQAAIARAQGQTAIAKAQTANQVKVAAAGSPSLYFLIAAGVGVLGLVLVARR